MKKITILSVLISIICFAGITHAGGAPIDFVNVDIKPMSCPNPFNLGSMGVMPVAILGTDEFDVTQIDPASILLAGVPPMRWSYDDVASAYAESNVVPLCPCNEEGPDGLMDLALKFNAQEIAYAIEDSLDSEEVIFMDLTGNLLNGIEVMGVDCLIPVGKMSDGPIAVRVSMCHMGMETVSVGAGAVAAHLAHGDTLGPCPE